MKITIEVDDDKAIAVLKEFIEALNTTSHIKQELTDIDKVEHDLEEQVTSMTEDIKHMQYQFKLDPPNSGDLPQPTPPFHPEDPTLTGGKS